HQLDLFQWICGMPAKVRGFCYEGKYHNVEVEDDATLYFEYENGAVGTFITSTGEWPGANRLEISGDMGKMVVEDGKIHLWRLPESERKICFETTEGFPEVPCTYSEPEITGTDGGHRAIIQNFTNACLYGEELIAPGAEGIRQISLSNAAYLSAWTDETVSLPLDSELFDTLLKEKAKGSSFHEAKTETLRDGYNPRWQVQW
ncbi:MAG: gfo/Idh/MocA family oxidoreductase, partial [Clostridia bacterium]|nr:gfo/Idh/MocA family oxidoreductase [Clostridia bacterium]